MDKHELTAIKCRLGSIPPRKLQDVRAMSEAVYKLITSDLPKLIDVVSKTSLSNQAFSSSPSEESQTQSPPV
jgi:hypothetical protein